MKEGVSPFDSIAEAKLFQVIKNATQIPSSVEDKFSTENQYPGSSYDQVLQIYNLNKTIQQKLLVLFSQIQEELRSLREKRDSLLSNSTKSNKLPKTTLSHFKALPFSFSPKYSFFQDYDGQVPNIISSSDDIRLMNLLYSLYPRHVKVFKWTPLQRIALAKAIQAQNQKILLDQLYEKFSSESKFLITDPFLKDQVEYDELVGNELVYPSTIFQAKEPSLELESSFYKQILSSIEAIPEHKLKINMDGLDWIKISDSLLNTKSPEECLIRWVFHDHPFINKQEWNKEELEQLKKSILSTNSSPESNFTSNPQITPQLTGGLKNILGTHKWQIIAEKLGTNRTAIDCFIAYQRKINTSHYRAKWTTQEDKVLQEAVKYFGDKNWQAVSGCLDGRSGQQCLHRWLKSINPKIHRGKWTTEEDQFLRDAVHLYGTSKWSLVQQMVPGRTDVQCRERWSNVLDPSLNLGKWSLDCSRRWKQLVKNEHDVLIPTSEPLDESNETDDDLAEVFQNLLSKQNKLPKIRLSQMQSLLEIELPSIGSQGTLDGETKIKEPLFPISLEPHNTLAFSRLLETLFSNQKEIDTSNATELPACAYSFSLNFISSNAYKDLYRRFEALFIWPYLLAMLKNE